MQYGDGSHDPEPEGPRFKNQDPLHFTLFVTVIEISYLLILINLGEDLSTLEPILYLLEPILCLMNLGGVTLVLLRYGITLWNYVTDLCYDITLQWYVMETE